MNTSRNIIVITGDPRLFPSALKIISGFKAITVVNQLNDFSIANVHKCGICSECL